jgi:pyridoxamine 5'-phosphate oxidase
MAAPRALDVQPDPYEEFAAWYADVEDSAVCMVTASAAGEPAGRTVTLEGFDERGFRFFTSYESPKARDLEANPRGALVWYWAPDRQVRAAGHVERLSSAESDAYWERRPRGHQLSVWASEQSTVIENRKALEERAAAVAARFEGQDVPRPGKWGGYRLTPDWFEFWRRRDDRLHDRWRYRPDGDGWLIERLAP